MSVVSYDTKNPAPPAEGAPPRQVKYSEMIALMLRYVTKHEGTRAAYQRAADEATTPAERASCLRFAARSLDESEVCAALARLVLLARGNRRVGDALRDATDAERGFDPADADLTRYE